MTDQPSRKRFIYQSADESPWTRETDALATSTFTLLHTRPRQWQGNVLGTLMAGYDVIVRAGTGYGKSLLFQSMAALHGHAIVLVIVPILALMFDQVQHPSLLTNFDQIAKMEALGIPCIGLCAESLQLNSRLWQNLRDGKFRFVFATPEILFDPTHDLWKKIVGDPKCLFRKNLVCVTIDECHLIRDWEKFRPAYRDLGRLKNILRHIPFLCLSATLTIQAQGYVHEVCRLPDSTSTRSSDKAFKLHGNTTQGTVVFNMPVKRDNINLQIAHVKAGSLTPLLSLIPHGIKRINEIPKVLIFRDSCDDAINLCKSALRPRLPEFLEGLNGEQVSRDTVVQCYYASIDSAKKQQTLDELRHGNCRIVICTDAFGIGIDIPDIDIVIQWHIDEKCPISTLWQRIGRAARGPSHIGIGILYIQTSLAQSLAKHVSAKDFRSTITQWEEAWNALDLANGNTSGSPEDPELDPDALTIPNRSAAHRNLKLYGLPVNQATETKGLPKRMISELFRTAKSLKEARSEEALKASSSGTTKEPMPLWAKLCPFVLWLILSDGCRHKLLGYIFGERNNFTDTHSSWCCDSCVFKGLKGDSGTSETAGIHVGISILNPQNLLKNETSRSNNQKNSPNGEPVRFYTPTQIVHIKHELLKLRYRMWLELQLPDALPSLLFNDKVIVDIAKNANRMGTAQHIAQQMERSGIVLEYSNLTSLHLHEILELLETIARAPERQVPIQPRPSRTAETQLPALERIELTNSSVRVLGISSTEYTLIEQEGHQS